jgi:predicted nucleic acid-binding protein
VFLLDTNVISELRKSRPHGAVLAWYEQHATQGLFLPSIALFELQAGVEATRRQDPAKAAEIERWIDRIAANTKILSLDVASARLTAQWMHGKPQELLEDAMIAAIAVTNGLTVATRNIQDFKQFEVNLVDPFLDVRAS